MPDGNHAATPATIDQDANLPLDRTATPTLDDLPRLTDDERDSLDTHAPVTAAPISEPPPGFHDHESGRRYEGFPAPLPCPFCGHLEYGGIVEVDCGEACDPRLTYHVQCDRCGAEGPSAMSAREAAEAWNGARTESFDQLLDDCQARVFEALEVLGLTHDALSGRGADGRTMSAIAAARRILKPLEVLGDTIAMREAAQRLSKREACHG